MARKPGKLTNSPVRSDLAALKEVLAQSKLALDALGKATAAQHVEHAISALDEADAGTS